MSNERTPQEQAAYEAGQRTGKQITNELERGIKHWKEVIRKEAFGLDPIDSTAIVIDDAKALPPVAKESDE